MSENCLSRLNRQVKKAGIYKLTCSINGKVYIGKSINIDRRLKQHKNPKSKTNNHLERAILKYGWDAFSVEILETVDVIDNALLLEREAYHIEVFDATNKDKGYNICKYSTDLTGISLSEEHKRKISEAHLGKILSDEHKEKLRIAHLGQTPSDASREKMRNARLGKTNESWIGKSHSEEAKEKISNARKGKPRSEETKEKIRQARLGKKFSEEHKANMRKPKLNRTTPDE